MRKKFGKKSKQQAPEEIGVSPALAGRGFTRTTEDFICTQCGHEVVGNGYTNHCPVCLWSKHVDVNPGDRASDCGGLMEPAEGRFGSGEYAVVHRCVECGFQRKNKLNTEEEIETFIRLMAF